jgi:hypothetical protein
VPATDAGKHSAAMDSDGRVVQVRMLASVECPAIVEQALAQRRWISTST